MPWRRKWQSTPVFLPGEFYGQKSLVGYSTCGCKELDMTEWLTLPLKKCTNYFFQFIKETEAQDSVTETVSDSQDLSP